MSTRLFKYLIPPVFFFFLIIGFVYGIMSTDVIPILNNTYDIGNSTNMYRDLYLARNMFIYSNLNVYGNLNVTGIIEGGSLITGKGNFTDDVFIDANLTTEGATINLD